MKYNEEKRICQNCKNDFIIELEDFNFYKKIKVPPPTWCPECRMIRKMNWRNERSLYKIKCDLCNKDIVSIYNNKKLTPVFCQECWWKDGWDAMKYGEWIDFSKTFFLQFQNLFLEVPEISLFNTKPKNSEYCNFAAENKNCYLFFGGKGNENLLYSHNSSFCKDSIDISSSQKLELCYEDIQCENSSRLFFSKNCENCVDSYFLYECKNCQNCLGCTNLRNKSYCIWNKQYTREEYLEKISKLSLGSLKLKKELEEKFYNIFLESLHKYSHFVNAKNCTGNNLWNAKNCTNCFDILGGNSENSKYTSHDVLGVKDSYDNYGISRAELVYETIGIGFDSNENSNYKFVFFVRGSNDITYSINCAGSSHLFGCVGLINKSYCILNRQYTKEEYEELIPKIIEHMNTMPYIDKKGRVYKYGEFFPIELSPFSYNETIAGEYFPLTKEEALRQGYTWKDKDERNYNIDIYNKDIPDDIKDTDDQIVGKVIECSHKDCNHQCTEAFKIIEDEYTFYKKMNLVLPRLCPNCRHYERLAKRNPMKLWHRKCMKPNCLNEFETSYAPDRPEIVYCESCYNKEIY